MKIKFKIRPINTDFLKNFILKNSNYIDESLMYENHPLSKGSLYTLDCFKKPLIFMFEEQLEIHDTYNLRNGKSIIIKYNEKGILNKVKKYLSKNEDKY